MSHRTSFSLRQIEQPLLLIQTYQKNSRERFLKPRSARTDTALDEDQVGFARQRFVDSSGHDDWPFEDRSRPQWMPYSQMWCTWFFYDHSQPTYDHSSLDHQHDGGHDHHDRSPSGSDDSADATNDCDASTTERCRTGCDRPDRAVVSADCV